MYALIIRSDQTNPKAARFKNNGFPYYDLMSNIMPKAARGTYAFRASQQSRGAASNLPASSSKGKGKGKGKAKGKAREQEQEQAILATNGENDDNGADVMLPPSPPTSFLSRNSTPISAGSGSKRKFSALEDDSSTSRISSSKKTPSTAAVEMATEVTGMKGVMRDMVTERTRHNVQQEALAAQMAQMTQEATAAQMAQAAQAAQLAKEVAAAQMAQAAQAAQASQEALESPSKRRREAVACLQNNEVYLLPEAMAALVDHIGKHGEVADLYMGQTRENYRRAWVLKQLKDLNFVGKVVDDE